VDKLRELLAHREREIAVLRRRLDEADSQAPAGGAAPARFQRAQGIELRDAASPNAEIRYANAPLLPQAVPMAADMQFRVLADAMPQMVWSARPDGYHDYYNRRWYEFTGAPEGSTDGERWNGMFHPDDQDRAAARWRHSLATGEPYEIEYRLRDRSGVHRWVLGRALPMRDEAGAIVRWFGTCTEIDELKRTEEALRANEEFTRRMLDSSGDCIKVLDLDARLLFMSGGGLRVMEVDDFAAISGCDWRDFWKGPHHVEAQAAFAAAKAGGVGRFQGVTPTMQGTVKWWDVVVTPINGPDGNPEHILSISRDITDTRSAEQAVRDREERYRLAARATNDAIWDWDLVTDQVLWNEAVRGLFGHAPDEVGATSQWWKDNLHPDDRDRVIETIHDVIAGDTETWQTEYRFRRRDGAYATVLDRGYVLRDGRGKPLRMIGAMLDLTERKRNEENLQLLNREMDHRIKNLFAVATSLTTLAAREAKTPKELATDLRERFATLARVHNFVRMQGHEMAVATLDELVKALLEPYRAAGGVARVTVDCLEVPVGQQSTTAVALIVHELATNAAKYGALSTREGRVDVRCSCDDATASIVWRESGGPKVRRPDQTEGFGSLLVRRSISDQLAGVLETEWDEAGITVTITVDRARLAA
jgi:PAS domain S-box-containing protein